MNLEKLRDQVRKVRGLWSWERRDIFPTKGFPSYVIFPCCVQVIRPSHKEIPPANSQPAKVEVPRVAGSLCTGSVGTGLVQRCS